MTTALPQSGCAANASTPRRTNSHGRRRARPAGLKMLVSLLVGLVLTLGLQINSADAVSGDPTGAPATCNVLGKACTYDSFNFVTKIFTFGANNTFPANVQYRDSSAYNRGSVGWDVRINTYTFNLPVSGYSYYCLSPGRAWANLSQKANPIGGDFNNHGFSNVWYQYYC